MREAREAYEGNHAWKTAVVPDKRAERAPIRDPLPQAVVVLASWPPKLAAQLPIRVMGPCFRRDDTEDEDAAADLSTTIHSRRCNIWGAIALVGGGMARGFFNVRFRDRGRAALSAGRDLERQGHQLRGVLRQRHQGGGLHLRRRARDASLRAAGIHRPGLSRLHLRRRARHVLRLSRVRPLCSPMPATASIRTSCCSTPMRAPMPAA